MTTPISRNSMERRAFDRYYHTSPIILLNNRAEPSANSKNEAHDYARMGNYSQNGLYFESDFPFKAGDWIFFKLSDFLDDNHEPNDFRGYGAKIIWCRQLSSSDTFSYGVGAEYAKPFTISKEEFELITHQ